MSKSCVLLYWQRYCTALEQWASAKLRCCVVQGMELRNFRSSSFSTEGTTYILRAAITLGIGPHSSHHYYLFTVSARRTLWVPCLRLSCTANSDDWSKPAERDQRRLPHRRPDKDCRELWILRTLVHWRGKLIYAVLTCELWKVVGPALGCFGDMVNALTYAFSTCSPSSVASPSASAIYRAGLELSDSLTVFAFAYF